MKLIIEDDEGRKTVVPLVRDEISIGRLGGNTIRLTERNISRKHARLLKQDGAIVVEDLDSYNGVMVNGDKIAKKTVKEGDLIEIGDYDLAIEGAPEATDGDTSPGLPAGHVEKPKDKTPPLAVPAPTPAASAQTQPSAPAPAPTPAPAPVAPAPAPSAGAPSDANATSVIRLSDLGSAPAEDGVRDLGPNEAPRIVALSGSLRGQDFPLRRSVVKFGRTDEGNDLLIDHQSISRSHGWFSLEGDGWGIVDNKSANGVRVDGEEYQKSAVKPGDTIELGHVKFRFCAPGERFVVPADAPAGSAPSEAVAAAGGGSKLPLILGGVGVVVVGGILAVVFAGPSGPAPECVAAQSSYAAKSWADVVTKVGVLEATGVECQDMPVASWKTEAETNIKIEKSLDEAKELIELGKFKRSISILKAVPKDSAFGAEAGLLIQDARDQGVKKLSGKIRDALSDGDVPNAQDYLEELEELDPDNPLIGVLSDQIAAKKRAQAAVNKRPRLAPVAQRNAKAKTLLRAGLGAIKGGKTAAGISKLKAALKLDADKKLDKKLMGKVCRTLGVAYGRMKQACEAVKYYKLYLKYDPNTREKAKVANMIKKSNCP